MKWFLLLTLILSSSLKASSDKLFILVTYYNGLGTKMRTETVVRYTDTCTSEKMAEVIFIDQTNEIREAAKRDEKGWWKNQPINDPKGMREIIALFKRASFKQANCLPKETALDTSNEQLSDEEIIKTLEEARKPLPLPPKKMPKEKLE